MANNQDDDPAHSDFALLQAALRDVRPLQFEPRHVPQRRRPAPRARFTRADRRAVLAESLADLRQPLAPVIESGEELQFKRDSVSPLTFKQLRRGQFRVDAELDLHGLTLAQAEQLLGEFLADALIHGLRVLRIVHGKGLRSGHRGPVLKHLVNRYLQRVDAVLAFASAREVDGGSGACLVLMGARRAAPRL